MSFCMCDDLTWSTFSECELTGCMLISQPVLSPGSFILSKPKRASMSSVNWLRSSRLTADIEEPSSLLHNTATFGFPNPIHFIITLVRKTADKLTDSPDLLHFAHGPTDIVRCFAKPSFCKRFQVKIRCIKVTKPFNSSTSKNKTTFNVYIYLKLGFSSCLRSQQGMCYSVFARSAIAARP